MAAAWALVAVALVGCAGTVPFPPCPAEGGPPWLDVQTAHFRVRTDLAAEDARQAALHLERTHAALLAVAWPHARREEAPPMEVVVLRDPADLHALFTTEVGGLVSSRVIQGSLMVVAGRSVTWQEPERPGEVVRAFVLNHELAHQLSHRLRLNQPRWLAEGIASFLETVEISADGTSVSVGAVNPRQHAQVADFRAALARDALAWEGSPAAHGPSRVRGLYATSWLLVHWLYNHHPGRLARYQARLVLGEEASAAWREIFPDLDPDGLDETIHRYARGGDYSVFRVPLRLPDPSITSSPLADDEVHAARATLASIAMRFIDRSQAQALAFDELDRSLARNPTNLTALLTRQSLVPSAAEKRDLARRATTAHPDSGAAWATLAQLLEQQGARAADVEEAYRKAIQRSPHDATALNNLAWIYARHGRHAEALPLSLRAFGLDPSSSATLDTHAHVLAALGRCSEAITLQRRALQRLSPTDDRATYARHLQEIEKRCQRTPASPR
jgi:tetratricopeptide (TPR) repeat protein